MHREDFIKSSLLATAVLLFPNAISSFSMSAILSSDLKGDVLALPDLKKIKLSDAGARFFESELSIIKSGSKLPLNRKYFISENRTGISTPAVLEKQKETFVFIPELYQDKRHNGFIVKLCSDGLCEETKIFTHENQGFYAFWGKEYLGQPTLYHYNFETLHLMRAHRENEQWINHRVMPVYPDEMIALYTQQLKQVSEGQLQQQFGYDFEIHKDGFYQFLALKHGWEDGIITREKEEYEKENPAKIFTEKIEVKPLQAEKPTFTYTNPFVPIYCKGDDLSHATIKPTIIYEEVAGTKIEIPDMPAYKTQDDIGDCKAFSLAVLLQHYTCQRWKSDIPDCKNPPEDSAISYFGLMAYTNQAQDHENTFQPLQEDGRSMKSVINDLSASGNRLILESCRPSETFAKSFSLRGEGGLAKRDEFFNLQKNIFETIKNKSEINIKEDWTQELLKLNSYSDFSVNQITLKKALAKSTFDQFLYTLFFKDCKFENFPTGFSAAAFPLDSMNVTPNEVKNQVIKGLNRGKPVLFPCLCTSRNQGENCDETHSLVISGFKQVKNGSNSRDIFKVHNSWGVEWQKSNNDGWIDADVICHNTAKIKLNGSYRISSNCVIWLDP